MKLIIAYIQPFKADAVIQALHDLPVVSGASVSTIRGFGRQRGQPIPISLEETLTGTVPKVRIEVAIADEAVEAVIEAIRRTAHTGRLGDGKILVVPIETSVRISSGERDARAL